MSYLASEKVNGTKFFKYFLLACYICIIFAIYESIGLFYKLVTSVFTVRLLPSVQANKLWLPYILSTLLLSIVKQSPSHVLSTFLISLHVPFPSATAIIQDLSSLTLIFAMAAVLLPVSNLNTLQSVLTLLPG